MRRLEREAPEGTKRGEPVEGTKSLFWNFCQKCHQGLAVRIEEAKAEGLRCSRCKPTTPVGEAVPDRWIFKDPLPEPRTGRYRIKQR